jgi:hypothetical protein
MKKDRLDDLSDSLAQIKGALCVIESIVADCYPNAAKLDKLESERKRQQDRANGEAVKLDGLSDCLRRLGLHIAAGARLCWGDNGEMDSSFYLFGSNGNGVAAGDTMQKLILAIPKGE